jgi:allophanate hydrolase subunit 2
VRTRLDPPARDTSPIRIAPGPQANRFDENAWHTLLHQAFTVSPASNRQGIRLNGPLVRPDAGGDIVSQGVVTGAIQVTGSGQPIVMLPARATIGGYPQIATVIAADLDRLGQLQPGDTVRFADTDVAGS